MNRYVNLREFGNVLKRRKWYFIAPVLLVSGLSTIGAFILPQRYESSTTIMVQQDKILNPLVQFSLAVTMGQDGGLSSFNEILFSRTSIENMLENLNAIPPNASAGKMEEIVDDAKRRISTSQRGAESFTITVADQDPVTAQKATTMLAASYIRTTQLASQLKSEEAVKFFEGKVDEYKKIYEEQQRQLMGVKHSELSSMPRNKETLEQQAGKADIEINELDLSIKGMQRTKALLENYIDNIDNPGTVSRISSLDGEGASLYIAELKSLSLKYNQLLSRFTPRYFEVQNARQQLLSLLQKALEANSTDIDRVKSKSAQILAAKGSTQDELSKFISMDEVSIERQSSYNMYKGMYEDMRQKLEAAKVSRDLGLKGEQKFVILDPAQVPTRPTKPNKPKVIGGGTGIGFLIGAIAVFLSEYLDPTIRRRQDIEVFQKPIIAYLH